MAKDFHTELAQCRRDHKKEVDALMRRFADHAADQRRLEETHARLTVSALSQGGGEWGRGKGRWDHKKEVDALMRRFTDHAADQRVLRKHMHASLSAEGGVGASPPGVDNMRANVSCCFIVQPYVISVRMRASILPGHVVQTHRQPHNGHYGNT
jgi:hypothetical protein